MAAIFLFFRLVTVTGVNAHTQAPMPLSDHPPHTVDENQQDQNNQNANQCF
jgi:hypothetical protein